MVLPKFKSYLFLFCLLLPLTTTGSEPSHPTKLAYLVPDSTIPYWNIMVRGVTKQAKELGYQLDVYNANNLARKELQNAALAMELGVKGIILSPTNSSAATTLLNITAKKQLPVVIADIGSKGGDYVSYISSANYLGAYRLGKALASELQQRGWDSGSVGIIAIPQKRRNGQRRTEGFITALKENNIKGADIYQQVDFSYQETFDFSRQLIQRHPHMRALFLQGSSQYQAALDAIAAAGKTGQILVVCFDAEPEFMQLIPEGKIFAAAMQQPYLMGSQAVLSLHRHLSGQSVDQQQKMPILVITGHNINQYKTQIMEAVLGQPDR